MSKLLLDEKPLVILPQLAVRIGLNEAIVLQQVHYWLKIYEGKAREDPTVREKHYRDGRWWVFNAVEDWQKKNFPFWSHNTVRRTLEALRKPAKPDDPEGVARGPLLIATGEYNEKHYDKTLWYSIDYNELERIEAADPTPILGVGSEENGSLHGSVIPKWANGDAQNGQMETPKMGGPIPETTPETNAETTKSNSNPQSGSVSTFPSDSEEPIIWEEPEGSELVEAIIKELSQTFGDVHHLQSNITRAYNLWDETSLGEHEFVAKVEEAAAKTKEAIGKDQVRQRNKRMAYFFSVLENALWK